MTTQEFTVYAWLGSVIISSLVILAERKQNNIARLILAILFLLPFMWAGVDLYLKTK